MTREEDYVCQCCYCKHLRKQDREKAAGFCKYQGTGNVPKGTVCYKLFVCLDCSIYYTKHY